MRRLRDEKPWHAFTASEDYKTGTGKLVLVRGGRSTYLGIHTETSARRRGHASFSGPANLRALARAILCTVPAPRKRKTKP